ncbi:MAG: hypothetical protein WCG30_03280 [Candidatus Saccharibacteria bacterium]
MNTATEALVLINSFVLIIFLSIGIVVLIKVNILFKKIDRITDKAENFVNSAEKLGVSLEKVATFSTYTAAVKNIVNSLVNK